MQANANEHLKTLKTYRRGRGCIRAQVFGANSPFPTKEEFLREEEKFQKSRKRKFENEKFFKKRDFCHIRACVRVKDEKSCYFQMCYAIECHKMPFKGIFSPVERTKSKNGIVIGYWQNKRSGGLKNGFLLF